MSGRGTEDTATRPAQLFALRTSLGLAGVGAAGGVVLLIGLDRGPWTPLERMDRAVARSLNDVVAGSEILLNVLRGVTRFGGRNVLTLVLVVGVGYLLTRWSGGRPWPSRWRCRRRSPSPGSTGASTIPRTSRAASCLPGSG